MELPLGSNRIIYSDRAQTAVDTSSTRTKTTANKRDEEVVNSEWQNERKGKNNNRKIVHKR